MVGAEEKEGEYGEKEQGVRREKPVVRPEEIPPVPENRFLLRRDMPTQEQKPYMYVFMLLAICLPQGQGKLHFWELLLNE